MKEKDLKNIWKSDKEHFEEFEIQSINNMKTENLKKSKRSLYFLIARRVIESGFFLFFFTWLTRFAFDNYSVYYYLLSALVLDIFCLIGLFGSLRQVVLILRLDYSGAVTDFQAQLEKLKAFTLQILRLMFLSTPFYFAYIIIGFKAALNVDIVANSSSGWLVSNLVVSLGLLVFSIWLYKKLDYRTKTKWIRKLIADNGGRQIHAALDFLDKIREFKSE